MKISIRQVRKNPNSTCIPKTPNSTCTCRTSTLHTTNELQTPRITNESPTMRHVNFRFYEKIRTSNKHATNALYNLEANEERYINM